VTTLRKDADGARRVAAKATGELEREQRKGRAAVERAQETAQKARAELKEVRRDLQAARRELERIKSAKKRSKARVPRAKAVPPGPRSALPVPKGRFEDDPATLEEWLDAPEVHLLVDGYNASMSSAGFAKLDLESQRERLIEELTRLARRKKIKATVVFDGSDVASIGRRPRGPVRVQYSASDEIADDYLVALLGALPPTPVVVATSDRELQERAAALGATIANSEQLLGLMR
jgi:predicted RNA-binding protein with PIN domain